MNPKSLFVPLLAAVVACATTGPHAPGGAREHRELAEARAVFERNLTAIVEKNREDYLACYRSSPHLVRTGPAGARPGFDTFATSTPTTAGAWPQSLDVRDLELFWIAPGVVYGTYRYTVVFDGVASTGLSERLFLREGGRWVIAVTTAFPVYE